MYGGGFATIPAYLRDLFGDDACRRHPRPPAHRLVGGRRARSGHRQLHPAYQIDSGVPKAEAYNTTMYVMAGLLVIGFLCNLAMKAVHDRYYVKSTGPGLSPQQAEGRA